MNIQNRDAGGTRSPYIEATDRQIRDWYGFGVGSLSLGTAGFLGYL